MVAQFPCRSCHKNVNKNHNGIFCDSCGLWIHSKCNKLSKQDYIKLSKEGENEPFVCLCCLAENIPFSTLNNNHFNLAVTKGVNFHFDTLENDFTTLSSAEIDRINKFKEAFTKKINLNDDDDAGLQLPDCNYYSVDEFQKAKFQNKKLFQLCT